MNQMLDTMNRISPEETTRMLASIQGIPFSTDDQRKDAVFGCIDGLLDNSNKLMAFAAVLNTPELAQLAALVHATIVAFKADDTEALNAAAFILQQSMIYHESKR